MTTSPFQHGKVMRPLKIALYGPEGVGKTTFASHAPAPAFLDCEAGTDLFDLARHRVTSWEELKAGVSWLYHDQGHGYGTAVIDTCSSAERLAAAYVCRQAGNTSIEDFGYGKGFTRTAEEFTTLLRDLDALVQRGLNVVILGHAVVKKFTDPAGADYDHWTLDVDKRILPQIKQWCDALLFADHDKSVTSVDQGFGRQRHIAKSWGQRIMFTEHRATHDAKNRFNLPERMELSWPALAAGISAYYGQ